MSQLRHQNFRQWQLILYCLHQQVLTTVQLRAAIQTVFSANPHVCEEEVQVFVGQHANAAGSDRRPDLGSATAQGIKYELHQAQQMRQQQQQRQHEDTNGSKSSSKPSSKACWCQRLSFFQNNCTNIPGKMTKQFMQQSWVEI